MPAPALTDSNLRHLLRRTEFVDRPSRVTELIGAGSIEAAVANILAVNANPPSVTFTAPANRDWERGQDLTHFWLDQMARDSARPFQERMAFFWHGHFCSELARWTRRSTWPNRSICGDAGASATSAPLPPPCRPRWR